MSGKRIKLRQIVAFVLLSICLPLLAATVEDGEKLLDQGEYAKAAEIWWNLAENGDKRAQNLFGELYRKGRGVARNYKQAKKWFNKSARQGYAPGQYNLARLYRVGKGTKKDPKAAAKWFTKAAEQGHIKAQYNIGVMLENGWGVDEDIDEAASWYQKAADAGDKKAAKKLRNLGQVRLASAAKNANISSKEELRFKSRDGNVNAVQLLLDQ
ncbi:MAG: tetratricopeptide repeat protein, partial [Thiohalomonadales bacterium]